MALRKPLVIGSSGQPEQIQAGDFIQNIDLPSFTNANAGSLVIGTPVYMSGNDAVDKAKADAVGTVNVIGLIADVTVGTAALGSVQTDGILSATTGQWDAVAGTTGGLTKDLFYYLDAATAGKLTATAPTTTGQFNLCVGVAVSTTELKINILHRIKL
jgi:hypothetical protein